MPVQFKNECVHVCMMCVYVDTRAIVHAWKSGHLCEVGFLLPPLHEFQGLNSIARTRGQDFYPQSHLACQGPFS